MMEAVKHQPIGEATSLLQSSEGNQADTNGLDAKRRRRAKFFLPVVVLTYFIGYIVTVIELNPYVYDQIAAEFPRFNSSSQKPCTENMSQPVGNTTGQKIQEEIEARVSSFELYLGLTTFLLAILPLLCLGPLTDTYGRKLGFLFPITGTLLKQIVYVLVIRYHLPLHLLYLAHLCEALGGGFAVMLMSMFSVISDVTNPGRERSFFITAMEAFQTCASSGAQIASAQWIKVSFLHPLYMALASSFVSLGVVGLLLPETFFSRYQTIPVRNSCTIGLGASLTRFIGHSLGMIKKSFQLYVTDAGGRLLQRRLCILVFILTVAVNFSKSGVWTLYLMKFPLCWSATEILTFSGVKMVCNWFIILVLLWVFQKLFNMPDRHVAIVGCISSLLALVSMSLATNNVMVYEAAVLGVMVRAIIPMLRAILSSLMDKNQQGTVYGGMGCIETVAAGVFGIAANRIYYATLGSFAGSVFLVLAALVAMALLLLIILNAVFQRMPQCRITNNSIQTQTGPR